MPVLEKSLETFPTFVPALADRAAAYYMAKVQCSAVLCSATDSTDFYAIQYTFECVLVHFDRMFVVC